MSYGSSGYKHFMKMRMKVSITWTPARVNIAGQTAGEKALSKFASFVWTAAHQSIRNKNASPPGTAMGRGSGFMRDSLVVENFYGREIHIGFFRGWRVGDLHEWGGRKEGRSGKSYLYPERPTMRLALAKAEQDYSRKFPEDFARYFGSVSRGYGD
jgi:hypothetical protein